MATLLMQNFITGWNGEFFTLASLGGTGRLHIEVFTDVEALDFKVAVLEGYGLPVSTAPALPMELYRRTRGGRNPSYHVLTYNPGDNQ